MGVLSIPYSVPGALSGGGSVWAPLNLLPDAPSNSSCVRHGPNLLWEPGLPDSQSGADKGREHRPLSGKAAPVSTLGSDVSEHHIHDGCSFKARTPS